MKKTRAMLILGGGATLALVCLALSARQSILRADSEAEGQHASAGPEAEAEPEGEGREGPELEQWYFQRWHQQYDATLPVEVVKATWDEIQRMPAESATLSVSPWSTIGPFGMTVQGSAGSLYSGRILDIDGAYTHPRLVASASGGLFVDYGRRTDALPSLAIGSCATPPGSSGSVVLIGTGEPFVRSGAGMFRSTDGGLTWHKVTMSPDPAAFYRIRFTPDNPNKVHAATTSGYYRSIDGGETWTRIRPDSCTDVAVSQDFLGIVYAAFSGDGLYKSADAGLTWTKLTSGGIPTTNVGRTAIALSPNPSFIYVSMVDHDDWHTLGVFRTTNGGTTWSNVTPPDDFHTTGTLAQGWYVNTIGVSPATANTCLVGGITLWRTTDGGSSWTKITDPDVHDDQHAVNWVNSTDVWEGNDGGLSFSNDAGATWNTLSNSYPITQYYNFDVGVSDPSVIFGGTQDNGLVGRPWGGSWAETLLGDGGGVTIDPSSAARIWGTLGFSTGCIGFPPRRSFDSGTTWTTISSGLCGSDWAPKIRNDRVPPVYLYTNDDAEVYISIDYGTNWSSMLGGFPYPLSNLNVSPYSGGGSVIYASLDHGRHATPPFTGSQLRVYDGGDWYERSTGFPSDVMVRGVAVHPTDPNKAYALMTGFHAGQKVFRTTNRGVTWTNISSNLPNVPMGDLVPHPSDDNQLFLGTEFGCYRTLNGGASWERWNNVMPEAAIVTEMAAIDRRGIDGTYLILAATYGRGIFQRDIAGADTIATGVAASTTPAGNGALLSEAKCFPNPFERHTTVSFETAREGRVTVAVYDVQGRLAAPLWDGSMPGGRHSIPFDAAKLGAGLYWYRVTTGGMEAKGRMTIIR